MVALNAIGTFMMGTSFGSEAKSYSCPRLQFRWYHRGGDSRSGAKIFDECCHMAVNLSGRSPVVRHRGPNRLVSVLFVVSVSCCRSFQPRHRTEAGQLHSECIPFHGLVLALLYIGIVAVIALLERIFAIHRGLHLSGPALSSRTTRSSVCSIIRLRQFFRYGESCVLCLSFSINFVAGKYLVTYGFRTVVAVNLSYWTDFGFQTDGVYLLGARLVAKLVRHVDVLVTDIFKRENNVMKYLVSSCLYIKVLGVFMTNTSPRWRQLTPAPSFGIPKQHQCSVNHEPRSGRASGAADGVERCQPGPVHGRACSALGPIFLIGHPVEWQKFWEYRLGNPYEVWSIRPNMMLLMVFSGILAMSASCGLYVVMVFIFMTHASPRCRQLPPFSITEQQQFSGIFTATCFSGWLV